MHRLREKRINGFPSEFVILGADIAARLVESDDHRLALGHAFSIHFHMIPRQNAGAHVDAGAAIDLHAAGFDEFITGAAGAHGAGGEVFIEARAV